MNVFVLVVLVVWTVLVVCTVVVFLILLEISVQIIMVADEAMI